MGRGRKRVCTNPSNVSGAKRRSRVKKDPADDEKYERDMQNTKNLLSGKPIQEVEQDESKDDDENEDSLNQFLPYDDVPLFDAPLPPAEVPANPNDAAIEEFVRRNREERYLRARERLCQDWEAIENRLTAAYLHSQFLTLNWTTQHSYLDSLIPDWRLASQPVKFCPCIPETVQLVYQGYLPASPKQPRTAFTIPLIQLFHRIWQTSVSSGTGFIEGLSNFLDDRSSSPLEARGSGNNRRDLTQPFSSTTHIYNRILTISKDILHHGLQFNKSDRWADTCSRCFGPAKNEIKGSAREADYIICMDGNFQHRHNKLASKDTPEERHYPAIFVRPSQMAGDQNPSNSTQSNVNDDPCSDAHKAANDTRSSSTWDKCDDTGLFAAACRHDVPLLLANIFQSGEKMYYPITLLQTILNEFPAEKKFGVLYDIGCHLDKHIKLHNLLHEHKDRIRLGTSVFHAYVHSWSCQLFYNPRFLEDWGLSDGEGLERIWSDLSPIIARLRTSTRLHRLQTIAMRSEYLTVRRQSATGEWLLRRLKHTQSTISESQRKLDDLLSTPNPYQEGSNYTREFFREQWNSERKINLAQAKDIKTRQRLELGRLLCLEDLQYKTWDTDAFDRQDGFDRLRSFQQIAIEISEQRKKIGISEMFTTLCKHGEDLLLKVWYSKTEVRTRFLALRAESRPLDPEHKAGGGSTLGTHEKERVLQAIQRRTRTMKKSLMSYNRLAQDFREMYPNYPTSPVVEYSDLIQMEADDPFWNNGIFTHSEEPWAIDHKTQMGMRALARLQRGQEELRRLGWEVRRAMRWATHEHDRVWNILVALKEAGGNPSTLVETFLNNPVANNPIDLIETFLNNPVLGSLSPVSRVGVVEGVLHNAFIKISGLEIQWDNKVMQVLRLTPAQDGDYDLMTLWKTHILRVGRLRSSGVGSTKAGDFQHLFPTVERLEAPIPELEPAVEPAVAAFNHDNGADNMSDLAAEEWEQRIDEGMVQNIMHAIGEEDL
ncbi:hypothetical protein DFH28DRAFT_924004 [Melampsora americana]|nr:hypothetical protein DFH28DRAFT_924004 [Melampsora americana]